MMTRGCVEEKKKNLNALYKGSPSRLCVHHCFGETLHSNRTTRLISANSDSSQKICLTHHMAYLIVFKAQIYTTDSMTRPLTPSVKQSLF